MKSRQNQKNRLHNPRIITNKTAAAAVATTTTLSSLYLIENEIVKEGDGDANQDEMKENENGISLSKYMHKVANGKKLSRVANPTDVFGPERHPRLFGHFDHWVLKHLRLKKYSSSLCFIWKFCAV